MFDVIVITAANEAQAAGYREQVAWRRANEGRSVQETPHPRVPFGR